MEIILKCIEELMVIKNKEQQMIQKESKCFLEELNFKNFTITVEEKDDESGLTMSRMVELPRSYIKYFEFQN